MASHHEFPLLSTIREVVDLLGGTMATAGELKVSPSAVSIWMRKDCFPPARYLDISAAVEKRGRSVERSLFRESPRLKNEHHAA